MKTALLSILTAALLTGATVPGTIGAAADFSLRRAKNTDTVSMLESPDGARVSWENLLHQYSGKVVYLDIWASWCGPCVHQVPFIESLKTRFSPDSVVFVSVSVDADPMDWREALAALQPGASQSSFLLLDGKHSSLNGLLHLKAIPRYVLLDRKGRLIDKNAPLPSSSETEGRIRTLLEKGQ